MKQEPPRAKRLLVIRLLVVISQRSSDRLADAEVGAATAVNP